MGSREEEGGLPASVGWSTIIFLGCINGPLSFCCTAGAVVMPHPPALPMACIGILDVCLLVAGL